MMADIITTLGLFVTSLALIVGWALSIARFITRTSTTLQQITDEVHTLAVRLSELTLAVREQNGRVRKIELDLATHIGKHHGGAS